MKIRPFFMPKITAAPSPAARATGSQSSFIFIIGVWEFGEFGSPGAPG